MLYDKNIDGVALTHDLVQKTFNLHNSPHRRLGFTKDRIQMFSPVFVFRKKSMLTNVFNQKLTVLQEVGLIDFWIKRYTDDRASKSSSRLPTRLRMQNIKAVFQIGAVLYLISFAIFILEVTSGRNQRTKKILDYLTY